jgi:hypothetical protein
MVIRKLVSTAILLVSASAASLAAATQEESDRIKAGLQAYLGSEAGVVAVAAQGDDYVITLDMTPYLAMIKTPGFSHKIDPFVLTARPKGNGQWDVSQSGSMAFRWTTPGGWGSASNTTVDGKIASQEWTGVFDEASVSFLSSTYAYKGITLNQTMENDQPKMKTSTATAYAGWSGTTTSVPRGDGSIDSVGSMSLEGVTSASRTELPPEMVAAGMPSLDYTLTNTKTDYTTSAKGFRNKAILELLSWFVAHPSRDLILKDQAQLKEKILAALPLWDSLEAGAAMSGTSISSAYGQFGIPEGSFGLSMSGISKTGKFHEAFGLSGLTIPPGLAPPWADGLIPGTIKFDFTIDGVDLEAPTKLFLAQADFSKDPPVPAETGMLFLPAFAPNNTVGLTIKDGEISSSIYSLTYDAAMVVSLSGLPTGKANIRMTGLEDVLAKVQAAASVDPMAQQAMGGLVAFKGFGKAQADGSMVWAIEVTADGKVMVNGLDVSAMMGMAPPPPQP